MLIESQHRRDEIDLENSVPVVLADGQEWYLPKPWFIVRPDFKAGVADVPTRLTYGRDLDAMARAVRAEQDPFTRIFAAQALGAFLLRRNYDLEDADLESLLEYHVGDPASREMKDVILWLAEGTSGPKAASGGGA